MLFQHVSEFSGFACFQTLGSEKDGGGKEALRLSGAVLSLRVDHVVTLGEESETRSHNVTKSHHFRLTVGRGRMGVQ